MISYRHPNASIQSPTLAGQALAIYKAIRLGQHICIENCHHTPGDLRVVAERLACDEVVHELVRLGVEARVTESSNMLTAEAPLFVSAEVCVYGPVEGDLSAFDADAGRRLAQRIGSGLSLRAALDRTLEQCSRPVLSEGALRQMEKGAEAAERRMGGAR